MDDGTLAGWIERRKLEAEYGATKQRLTLRIGSTAGAMLRYVADELEMSKTACAEQLLERAIFEAFIQLDMFSKLTAEQRLECGWTARVESEAA